MPRQRSPRRVCRHVLEKACRCESLEARRLLTYTVFGTTGDDVILASPGGNGYIIQLNHVQVANSSDLNVILSPLGGHDQVVITEVLNGASITVRGGLGDDYVEVGDGRLFNSLRGHVYIEEFGGQGQDRFLANDVQDTTTPDWPVRIRDNVLTSGLTLNNGVHYDDNVEFKTLSSSNAADTVYVESPPAGMVLGLGDGDDTVEFGSITGNDLPDFMAPGTVTGAGGSDRVVFEDSGQNDTGVLEYAVTATRFCNQQLIGVELVDLNTRHVDSSEFNRVSMSGNGGVTDWITVRSNAQTTAYIGSQAAPIDIGALGILLDLEVSDVRVYDQNADLTAEPFQIYTAPGDWTQRLVKGVAVRMPSYTDIEITGGTANDLFAVSGVVPGSNITINGGGGDDMVYTRGLNGHDNDLDDLFIGNSFAFSGGTGYDTFDLDDSADQTGDGDEVYHVGFSYGFTKGGGQSLVSFNGYAGDNQQIEQIRLVTGDGDADDDDDNTIYFGPTYGFFSNRMDFYIDGGGGDDLFTNYDPAFNGGNMDDQFDATIVGSDGTDTIALDDTHGEGFSSPGSYHFRSDYRMEGTSDATYDATTEFVTLDANDFNNTVRIDAKPLLTTLTVNGRGGNDSFTVGGGDIDSNGFSLSTVTVNGGLGINSMRFDDHLDDHPDGSPESETYIHTVLAGMNKLGKGTAGVNYSSCDSLTIDTGNVATGFLPVDNVLKLNTFSSFIASITINGGNVRSNDITVTTGNLANVLNVPVTLNMGTALGDVVNIMDQGTTSPQTYQFKQTYFARNPGASQVLINHTGVDRLNLSAGTASDFVSVEGIAAGAIVEAHGNSGDDRLNIEDGAAWGALDGQCFLVGDAGNDLAVMIVNNQFPAAATLTSTGMSVNGGPVQSFFDCGSVIASFGAGGASLNITSMATPCQINFGNGNDHLTIGDGRFHENITRNISVGFGLSSGDSITYDDRLDTGNDNYQITAGDIFVKPLAGGGLSAQVDAGFFNGGTTTILANNGDNQIALWSNLTDARVFAGAGNDTVSTYDGFTTIDTGPEGANPAVADIIQANVDYASAGDQPATVKIAATDRVSDLRVYVRGKALIPTGVTLDVTNSLALGTGGVIDMNGGAMIVRNAAGAMGTIKNLIKTGRANGAWNGTTAIDGTTAPAINSSLAASTATGAPDAVGYARGSDLFGGGTGMFAGVSVDANCLLWRYAVCGDADLNGVVNFDDYSRIDNAFNTHAAGEWFRGDFDYNNAINFDDYALIDLAFNSQNRSLRTHI